MIDIESTGVDLWRDEVLEIGIVEMLPTDDGLWAAGREFHTFVHSNRAPITEFARAHMVEVYRKANLTPKRKSDDIRQDIVNFLKDCGRVGHGVFFCGWNASNFDLPMLHQQDLLEAPGYETVDGVDKQVGDHHYRIYEMGGAVQYVSDMKNMPRANVQVLATELGGETGVTGKDHDALYDCHKQIRLLNGLIKLGRTP